MRIWSSILDFVVMDYIRNIIYALTIEIDLFEPSAYKPLIKKNFQLTSI